LLLLCLVLCPAGAAPVSFNFDQVSLLAFSQSTFKNLLHADYVISPDVLAMDRKITLSVSAVPQEQILAFVEKQLKQQGIAVVNTDGIYYLSTASKVQPGDQLGTAAPIATPSAVVTGRPGAKSRKATDDDDDEELSSSRKKDDESQVYKPVNRPAEFLSTLVNSTFSKRAAAVAGSSLVITGSTADLKKILALLEMVDVSPALVDVSASWVEVTESEGANRGISLVANVLGAKLGIALGEAASSSAISLRNANFQLVIDALNSDSRFRQVSNSRVVGDDAQKLLLSVGDETPTIGSTGKDNAGNAVSNVVYRPSGVIVDVLPHVLGSGRIQLLVDGQISSFKQTLTGVAGSPTLIKRQVKTQVTVGDGDVLLIGGLTDTQATSASSGYSFLPASWAVKSKAGVRTDLVLVLTAKVVKAEPN
jgi:type II secretory pathway component GspD/PulD (secretin)